MYEDLLLGKITIDEFVDKMNEKIYERIKAILYNCECLDNYDFSEFLTEGRSLSHLIDSIEYKYDKEFKDKYGIYMFDDLTQEEIQEYFKSRYNISFQPYTDWVVRREGGLYGKVERRK